MSAADKELGDEVLRPQYMLLGVALLGTERHPDASKAYFELIPPRSATKNKDSAEYFPEASTVWLLTHDELESVNGWLPEDGSALRHRGFAYSPPPLSKKRAYLISGRSEDDLVEAVGKFSALDDDTPTGCLVALDRSP